MSEAVQILRYIGTTGGCLLSDIAIHLGIPVRSVNGWVVLLCSTGYLHRSGQYPCASPCGGSGPVCSGCCSACHAVPAGLPVRIAVTERGWDLIRRNNHENRTEEPLNGD